MGDASVSPVVPNHIPVREAIASSSSGRKAHPRSQIVGSATMPPPQAAQAAAEYYQHAAFMSQIHMPPPQAVADPYNMGHMAISLPNSGNYHHRPLLQGGYSGQPGVGQMPMPSQMGSGSGHHFYMQQPVQVGYYAPISSPSHQHARMSAQGLAYYSGQVIVTPQSMGSTYYYVSGMPQYPGLQNQTNEGGQQQHHNQQHQYQQQQQSQRQRQASPAYMPVVNGQPLASNQGHRDFGHSGRTTLGPRNDAKGTCLDIDSQGVVRGPPRKPKQSGHAIWIGNLPPQTDLMQLVHHVYQQARGLDSLFLMSKSNCAFANFKDDKTCVAAQQKLHDSKFHSVRLVSRLRKSSVEGSSGVTAPTGPAAEHLSVATTSSSGSSSYGPTAPVIVCSSETTPQNTSKAASQADGEEGKELGITIASNKSPGPSPIMRASSTTSGGEHVLGGQEDIFFILKSLTSEDLDLSVRTGIWATQAHNEQALNTAFQTAHNVYLIFSANKSGEYFGYARMVSEINSDPAAAIEFAPKVQFSSVVDLPRAIATEATEFAPKGRIIDDSARGTIFWEVDQEGEEVANEEPHDEEGKGNESNELGGQDAGNDAENDDEGEEEQKAWGKPFKLEWLSTTRLPFYRTRGLRNPWNSNREVKIARDGTQLEPSVGRRLIGLFSKAQSSAPPSVPDAGMKPVHSITTAMAGYPPPLGYAPPLPVVGMRTTGY